MATWAGALRDCLVEARPVVLVIFLMRFLAGVALAAPALTGVSAARLLLGTVSWCCAVVFVYLFNGATDVVEDRASAKDRPIARGDLPPATAQRYARYFATAGIVGASFLGPVFVVLLLALLGLGYLYSAPRFALKRHCLGAAGVAAAGGALTFVAGYLLAGGRFERSDILVLTLAMSAWMGCVGSVAKDFSDIRGDRIAGRRTLVLVVGQRAARAVVAAAAIGVATAYVAAASSWAPALGSCALVMLVGSLCVAFRALTTPGDDSTRARAPYRAFMTTQYLAMASVLVAG
jgi:4-hydroxybenzoate polyprenyltransferase